MADAARVSSWLKTALLLLVILALVLVFARDAFRVTKIRNLDRVKPGMAAGEVRTLLGPPNAERQGAVTADLLKLPTEIHLALGTDETYLRWDYLRRNTNRSVSATVWMVPASATEPHDWRVFKVTTRTERLHHSAGMMSFFTRMLPGAHHRVYVGP